MRMKLHGKWVTGVRKKYKREFHDKILGRIKRSTIRGNSVADGRNRKPVEHPDPGDIMILEAWEGKPYRSKVMVLGYADITEVRRVSIETGRWATVVRSGSLKAHVLDKEIVLIPGDPQAEELALIEGFDSVEALAEFFQPSLPFEGVQIMWENFRIEP